MSESDIDQTTLGPEGYECTVSKDEADFIVKWGRDYEVGDSIKWTNQVVHGVQESTVIGFSRRTPALPVIEAPEQLDEDGIETCRVDKNGWVPENTRSIAEIGIEYTQRMTVSIPVDEMPGDERDAFHLVKKNDPFFVADVLPNRWDEAVSVGEIDVVDIAEEEVHSDGE